MMEWAFALGGPISELFLWLKPRQEKVAEWARTFVDGMDVERRGSWGGRGGRDPEGAVDRTVMDDREMKRRLGAS